MNVLCVKRGCVKYVPDNASCANKNAVRNVVLKSLSPRRGECADVVCRGEDGDPICMVCLAEMTNDSDGGGQS